MFAPLFRWLESRIDVFAPFDEREVPPRGVWRFMWHHIKGVKGWMALIMLTGLGFSGIEALMYLMVGWFVDLLTHSTPEAIWRDQGWLLIGAAFLLVVVRPLIYFANHAIVDQVVVPQITNQIRWRNHVYTLGHALSYFQNDFAGRLSARVIQAGQSIRGATIEVIDDLWYALIFATVALGFFGKTSLWLALPVVLWLGAYVALLAYFVPRAKKRSEANSLGRSSTTGRIVDAYTNILTVKLFARADAERSAVRESLGWWNESFLNLSRLITGVSVILQTMNSMLVVATAALSLWLWSHGAMTPGAVAAAIGLVLRLVQMSSWLIHLVRGIFENLGSVQESMETIAKPHDLPDAADAVPLLVERGEIRFEKIRFNYGKAGGLFEGLDLAIAPGERIGLVGPSGAGKSTLVNLLLRLYPLEGGRILIDGQDIAHVTQDSLRAQIGMVTQDNSLLHRSIGDNIAYGRIGAGDEEIARAARQAAAHDFILGLGDQDGRKAFESRVGERGVKLSGGQRQRIAIARVLLKDAPILVLDEATSALDSEVEAVIQQQLSTLMQGKTVIAIAHRLSTIAELDRLVVLDKGRIVDIGSHAELIAREGLYARLWSRQSGGFLAAADPEKLPV
ncbi:ABC transporter ATP-binding protein [Bosea sp. TND4EK4]|uniref:ABC transporter ATP-binding protein n=1 Tax=Bosea sp. TND4EK4 TaxID=1907408 RepID=UPI000953A4E2|nr:ABC transporter ATP-binding protein [Bosea sp. TND4EK4]SIQ34147.1 ATP-binding cassette, subfamily B, multidrug efflux pump [Bosea sp. TND4EK4]